MKASTSPRTSPIGVIAARDEATAATRCTRCANGQGIVALMALGMLEHFELRSHPVDGPDERASARSSDQARLRDAWRYVADLDHRWRQKPAGCSTRYLKSRAR